MKKISIITINYNNCDGLKQTIQSVMEQTSDDFEFIVIDGASSDGSKALIESYAHKVNFWVSEPDKGIYDAQNKGIQFAKGEYCLFLNSGDFLCDATVIEKVLQHQLDKDIVYGDMKINWGNNSITPGKMPDSIDLDHMVKDTLWHPVSFIKRELFQNLGNYNLNYTMVADYDFFFRALIVHRCSRKHIPVFIAEYNTMGISSDATKKSIEWNERKKVISSYLSADELNRALKRMKPKNHPFKKIVNFLKSKFNA